MSSLREQIRRDRAAYRQARYPGDLAADVLGPPAWVRAVRWGAGAGAAAAVIAVVLWSNGAWEKKPASMAGTGEGPVVQVEVETAVPAIPAGVQLMPPGERLEFPPMPAMPSMFGTAGEGSSSTTQESV